MQMRETIRSLRLYFILSGLAGALISGPHLRVNLQSSAMIETGFRAGNIALSLAFLYIGISLKGLLRTAPERVITILYVTAGRSAFNFLIRFVRTGIPSGLLSPLLGLLIIWYLLTNVRRIGEELQIACADAAVP
jgi:hypothetical protein